MIRTLRKNFGKDNEYVNDDPAYSNFFLTPPEISVNDSEGIDDRVTSSSNITPSGEDISSLSIDSGEVGKIRMSMIKIMGRIHRLRTLAIIQVHLMHHLKKK